MVTIAHHEGVHSTDWQSLVQTSMAARRYSVLTLVIPSLFFFEVDIGAFEWNCGMGFLWQILPPKSKHPLQITVHLLWNSCSSDTFISTNECIIWPQWQVQNSSSISDLSAYFKSTVQFFYSCVTCMAVEKAAYTVLASARISGIHSFRGEVLQGWVAVDVVDFLHLKVFLIHNLSEYIKKNVLVWEYSAFEVQDRFYTNTSEHLLGYILYNTSFPHFIHIWIIASTLFMCFHVAPLWATIEKKEREITLLGYI